MADTINYWFKYSIMLSLTYFTVSYPTGIQSVSLVTVSYTHLDVYKRQGDDIVDCPTLNDIEVAVGKLKNNTAPGQNNLPTELLKHRGETVNLGEGVIYII